MEAAIGRVTSLLGDNPVPQRPAEMPVEEWLAGRLDETLACPTSRPWSWLNLSRSLGPGGPQDGCLPFFLEYSAPFLGVSAWEAPGRFASHFSWNIL